jgi:DNA excision repair protein ERCC-3
MATRDPDTGQVREQVSPEDVLDLLDRLNLPFITSKLVAEEFDFTTQTARNKLATLVDQGDLTRVDLDQRRAVWCRTDYEAATDVAGALREHFDLAAVATEHLGAFAEEPYCILPKQENEAYVVVPRFVPFHVGWLDRQTASHNVFVVNKYVDWIDELPDDIRAQVGISQRYDHAVVADGQLEITPSQRAEAWEEFATDRDQDAIPGDDRLAAMDWDRLRSLASRLGVLEQGMTREAVEHALAAEREDDQIPLKPSREFDVIAGLIEDGNLPFAPQPVDEADLRSSPSSIDLRDYQERAWERFVETGMIGVYWPPSAGKTFLALYAGERVLGSKLVVVPNNTLKEQWTQRIETFCEHPDEWEIQTYQYLTGYDNIDDYQGDDGPTLTVFDESHYLPANTFAKLATIDTDYRIGLSASPYREDERTEYIFALTGFPVGLRWQELVALGAVETPDAKLLLYDDQEAKQTDVPRILAERPGKTLVLCDSLDRGRELAEDLDAPFVSGETRDRMEVFRDPDHRVVIGSRVADEGLSLADLDVVVEYDFHGGSRRQEAQRYGRVMHGESTGEHLILMTDAEYEKYSKRLLSLEEQGITVVPERRE